ncbi:nitroreductase/quinone reductase family protein [Hamadaea sp. NPDC051192]|uniref:nitroreductase/quinone reductase family protein n=1 Tax=Hamadaea sp. NPDC051192 TaxID=3154940 RepID=UPI0034167E4F
MLVKLAQRLGRHQWFARTMRVILPPLDIRVARLTKGKVIALGILPSLVLTTTGRKSGEPRRQPLIYVPDGDGYVVIGSNWGQPNHPAWSGNLLADPAASVLLKGQEIPVRAELAEGPERERLWELLLLTWPAYSAYAERSGRRLRIFKLNPTR